MTIMTANQYKAKKVFGKASFYVANIIVGLVFVSPLLYMLISSFNADRSLPVQIRSFFEFFPSTYTLGNFEAVFTRIPMLRYIGNSLLYSLTSVILGLIVNSMAGYALAKYTTGLTKFLFGFIIVMLIIPFEGITLSLFIIINRLGMMNTPFAVILPSIMNCFYIFMFRQFFLGIPDSLIEAAEIDGAGSFAIFFKIVVPMSIPVFITVFLLDFFAKWNDFYWPMLTLTDSSLFNVQLAINMFSREPPYHFGNVMASLTTVTLPIIVLFFFLQKYYIGGIVAQGIKE